MEINPRFWGSISAAIQAGLDFPSCYWDLASNESFRTDSAPALGVITHLLHGEAVYLLSILQEDSPYIDRPSFRGETRAILSSIADYPHFDYLSREDPGSFVRDLRNTVAALI